MHLEASYQIIYKLYCNFQTHYCTFWIGRSVQGVLLPGYRRSCLLTLIKSPLLAGTVKSYSCSSMQFRHWPFAGPLKAPPLCWGYISVTLSKHFIFWSFSPSLCFGWHQRSPSLLPCRSTSLFPVMPWPALQRRSIP